MKLLDFRKKNNNIYKVEYIVKPNIGKTVLDPYYINIIIPKLNIQYYYNQRDRYFVSNNFINYGTNELSKYNEMPFDWYDLHTKKIKIKNIEINDQLKALLFCKDELSNSIAKQVIFQKLGLNE